MGLAVAGINSMRAKCSSFAPQKGGSCPPTAMALASKPGPDPATSVPQTTTGEWLTLRRRMSEAQREQATEHWPQLLRKLQCKQRWSMVKGPMSAALATLLGLGWEAPVPTFWSDATGYTGGEDRWWYFDGCGSFGQL